MCRRIQLSRRLVSRDGFHLETLCAFRALLPCFRVDNRPQQGRRNLRVAGCGIDAARFSSNLLFAASRKSCITKNCRAKSERCRPDELLNRDLVSKIMSNDTWEIAQLWARSSALRFIVAAAADTGMVGEGALSDEKLSSPKVYQRCSPSRG